MTETLSITTGKSQSLYLDEKDFNLLGGRSVVVLDDVTSTGSTLKGMRQIVEKVDGRIAAESAILIEGDLTRWKCTLPLRRLPRFRIDHD